MLTIKQAAETLGVSPATIRSQVRNGAITGVKVGPVWTFTTEEVERYRSRSLGRRGPQAR